MKNKPITTSAAEVIRAMNDLLLVRRDGSDTARIAKEVNAGRVKAERVKTKAVYHQLCKLHAAGRIHRVRRATHPFFGWSLVGDNA